MLESYASRLSTQRWLARAPRIAATVSFSVLALVGLRVLVSGPAAPPRAASPTPARDVAAEAFAESFARDYLTWDGDREPAASGDAGSIVEPPKPPRGTRQRVTWTGVSSVERVGGRSAIVVSARTTNGPLSLAVTIATDRSGALQVDGQPAVVGGAPEAARLPTRAKRPVTSPDLETTVERALRNYLARDGGDLSADLTQGARVTPPDVAYRLRSVDELTWVTDGQRVAASVRVIDSSRVEQSLRYELAVVRVAGRWLIRAVQTHPPTEVTP